MLDRLAKEQRIFSRRIKGSKRWNKQRIRVAKLHEKVANQRKNFLHHICGVNLDRDYNSAINIKNKAMRKVALT